MLVKDPEDTKKRPWYQAKSCLPECVCYTIENYKRLCDRHSYGENGCYQPFEDLGFDIWRHSPDDLNETSKNVLLWARSVVVVLSRMFGKTENANVQIAIWSELREETKKACTGILNRFECVREFCNTFFRLRFVSALEISNIGFNRREASRWNGEA